MATIKRLFKKVSLYSICLNMGASWCNFTDDVTTYPMMTLLCVIELIMLGLVYGLGDVINIMTSLYVISL